VVLSDADETPIGRASVALKTELPSLFPEHGFEFLGPQDLTGLARQKRTGFFSVSLRRK
jgi:hypothetical protein